ncbi:isoflavone reductase [Citrus sinensis]|uniref:Isoflavone reductase n=1 Tax=Citrus sinensis TaxID=2711 RepID=A0ACB8KWG3_CITSI|nr:isoflavone reductase [Citrus sinensis]
MAEKSKILVVGGTGYIGKFIVEASVKAGHPTFALVRENTVSDPVKGKLVEDFRNLGVTLLHGDLHDHESLVKAIKQVDVVISTVGNMQLADQTKLITAIKEAGNVKPGVSVPPRDKLTILGDGNAKAVFNKETDIATFTIKAVDDPRTLNKVLYIRPPKNTYSFNELVALWEKLIGKTLDKVYVPEDQLLKNIQEAPLPLNIVLAINHSVFVNGDQTNFAIEPSFGVEASELYPDVKYTTVEEYLHQFV